jgi:hypothetical protein
MIDFEHDGLPLLAFEALDRLGGFACAISTRRGAGGMEFNLAPARGPDRGARAANWRRLASAVGVEQFWPQLQVHGGDIVRVTHPPSGYHQVPEADACFTTATDLGLLAFCADCPLVAVYQPGVAVGLAHASWRSTTQLIVRRLVARLVDEAGCDASRMWAGIGPSAGPHNYEVGHEVYDAAVGLPDRDDCFTERNGSLYFNLWRAAAQQLVAAGVSADRIETAGICTIQQNSRFFSYRAEGAGVGLFGMIVARRLRGAVT